MGNEAGNLWIKERLKRSETFIAGRLGAAESCLVKQWLKGETIKTCSNPHWASGIYPENSESFSKFASIYYESLKQLDTVDAMASIPIYKEYENDIFPTLKVRTILSNRAIEPFYFDDPWSQYLNGKVVLVIHAFTASIRCQLNRKIQIFKNPKMLPKFTAKYIQMPQCLGGQTPHSSYFETLNSVEQLIDGIGFRYCDYCCGSLCYATSSTL